MPEPASPKAALRRHHLALRDALDPLERETLSARVCRHIADHCRKRGIRAVAAFWPLGSELDLRPLVDANPFLNFYFPRIVARDPPRLAWGSRPLGPGTWGLQEPLEAPFAAPPVQLILVPGLAFAADGQRLGYGKGFYDVVLRDLPPDVATLGAGFALQAVPSLPASPLDVPVGGLVDENGIRWINRA
jgi:5-formyltetrahydrofolate cyclo-ligase